MRAQRSDERGVVTLFVVLLAVAVLAAGAAVWGLVRTARLAGDIDRSSASIADAGSGINLATRSIIGLDKTNEFGDGIEATAQPLESKLAEVVSLAKSIDGIASSINGTAGSINGTADGINSTAAAILVTGRSINDGVATINNHVMTTIELVRQVKADTANIIAQALHAQRALSCIDKGLTLGGANSSAPDDGHCR